MPSKLEVVVVGAGLGGLAAALSLAARGHGVIVLEKSSKLGEIGAGIQVTPNLTRVLHGWGLQDALERDGVKPDWVRQVRWSNGKELTRFSLNLNRRMSDAFGFDYYHIHRNDLQLMLLRKATELGAVVKTGCLVVGYRHLDGGNGESEGAEGTRTEEVTMRDGTTMRADLVIAADGNKSVLTEFVLGHKSSPVGTGDSAYRALLTREQMQRPEFEDLLLDRGAVVWLGPGSHVVGYYVHGKQFYNLVIIVPTDAKGNQEESWKLPGDMTKLRAHFKDWDPRLRLMLEMIDNSYVWNLRDRSALDQWLHSKGNMILLGDAAHPMLPYVAQGAATAIEDAAALAECLEFISDKTTLRGVLDVYQRARIPRAFSMCQNARKNRHYFHLPDGPEQQKRDADLARESECGTTANILNNRQVLQWTYGYDVVKEVRNYFVLPKEAVQAKARV